jgi:hypothetical protein
VTRLGDTPPNLHASGEVIISLLRLSTERSMTAAAAQANNPRKQNSKTSPCPPSAQRAQTREGDRADAIIFIFFNDASRQATGPAAVQALPGVGQIALLSLIPHFQDRFSRIGRWGPRGDGSPSAAMLTAGRPGPQDRRPCGRCGSSILQFAASLRPAGLIAGDDLCQDGVFWTDRRPSAAASLATSCQPAKTQATPRAISDYQISPPFRVRPVIYHGGVVLSRSRSIRNREQTRILLATGESEWFTSLYHDPNERRSRKMRASRRAAWSSAAR